MDNEDVKFEPDITLEPHDRVALAGMLASPGFRVFQRIMKASVDQIGLNLMNTPSDDEGKVISRHRTWKMAGQYYTLLVEFLNREKEIYAASIPNNTPIDAGDGLDLGETVASGEQDEEGPF